MNNLYILFNFLLKIIKQNFVYNIALIFFVLFPYHRTQAWGFYAHRLINEMAVYTLPLGLFGFYKSNIIRIVEMSVRPDKRRYLITDEAPKHYIDLEAYGDSAAYYLPRAWHEASSQIPSDTLMEHGIVPWHIQRMKNQLTKAFKEKREEDIIRLSAEIGHYIADAHVPLHTTVNYNGQLTDQHGIHAFWETRLPELFGANYDFFVGQAQYLFEPTTAIWDAVITAHEALDSVLSFEADLTTRVRADKKYSFETRNQRTVKVYSRDFSEDYHRMLAGQVERQMRAAVRMVGAFWLTCWVDAGQPKLSGTDVVLPMVPKIQEAQSVYKDSLRNKLHD